MHKPPARERKRGRRMAAESRAALAPLKREIGAAERAIEALMQEKDEIVNALAQPELYAGDAKRVVALQMRFRKVERDLASAEERWLDLQQTWEEAADAAP